MKWHSLALANLFSTFIAALVALVTDQYIKVNWPPGVIFILVFLLVNCLITQLFYRYYLQFLESIELALLHFKDGEFSISIPKSNNSKLRYIGTLFDQVADSLRNERSTIMQRELLLDRVFNTASSGLLLIDHHAKIALCNPAATQLLSQGKAIRGASLQNILRHLPHPLAESIERHEDVLFTLDGKEGEPEIWQLTCENFRLHGQEHYLYHFKQMTRTLARAEVDTWKKVIRVLSHELNNSLAPITSLTHSGTHILSQLQMQSSEIKILNQIFLTLGERTTHLNDFLSSYAQFAHIPKPQKQAIDWPDFLSSLKNLIDFSWREPLPLRQGFADTAQLSQVLINLIKNAREAGATPELINLQVIAEGEWDKLILCDNGSGMTETQLQQSLLPFYSTKRGGTGLGLALCREIIDAHEGRIKLTNRKDGGLQVTLWLPAWLPAKILSPLAANKKDP